ncbi:9528_t:CDS:1, partial [Funneliformis geosporum]
MSEKALEENEESAYHEKVNTKNITYNKFNKVRKWQKEAKFV